MPIIKGDFLFFDIHSHILPAVDDGAADMSEALKLLEKMQNQGITAVMATPHFYPEEDNLNDFSEAAHRAFDLLKSKAEKRKLPEIYLGCEMLYFEGIGLSESLGQLCLGGSAFLLLELTDRCINDRLFTDIKDMLNSGITPIIAHIERYCKARNYSKLLRFVLKNGIPTQINSSSFLIPSYRRVLKKLIKSGAAYIIATDTHSLSLRPPTLSAALKIIEAEYGREYRVRFIKNSEYLYKRIALKENL